MQKGGEDENRKRKEITGNAPVIDATKKRKSRFADDDGTANNGVAAIAAAAARAAEFARNLQLQPSVPSVPSQASLDAAAQLARAAEMQAQLSAQIASVSSLLCAQAKAIPIVDRKPTYRALMLDAHGREIDEFGQVVKTQVIKSIAANVAIERELKKKENPYLAHQRVPIRGGPGGPPGGVPGVAMSSSVPGSAIPQEDEGGNEVIDERIVGKDRSIRAKKSLKFVEAGVYMQKADEMRYKEERKIIAGYSSGRKAPEVIGDDVTQIKTESDDNEDDEEEEPITVTQKTSTEVHLPPRSDIIDIPVVEWWDEVFLSKENRDIRKKVAKFGASSSGSGNSGGDVLTGASFVHVRTHIYVQHPIAVKALGGEKPEVPLPMYLTKKERKRIRKTAREERESEKRDKMMMGLLPAPEPKFKLSNFMKVLGDQAIADPSKVEMRVLQQMRQRELNHEMRNLSAKLTPAERKAKRTAKLQEDTSRQVYVAVFRIKDFSDPKHRFKVDVNAQQHFLSGTVILCQPQPEEGHAFKGVPKGMNLVVVEGGPKGIKKFVSLMLKRIPWNSKVESYSQPYQGKSTTDTTEGDEEGEEGEEEEEEEAPRDGYTLQQMQLHAAMVTEDVIEGEEPDNSCQLLWQGIQAKRTFTGFKFQDCRSLSVARKLLDGKGVAHYWDMAFQVSGDQ